jgi:hypothetical protein
MRVRVVTPPSPIVLWADADKHLELAGDMDQKTRVEGLIATATAHIDGPGGWLGRSIGQQTLEAYVDSFACRTIALPFREIVSVTSVKYTDASGVEQTVDSGDYALFGHLLEPAHGKVWPSPRTQREAVRIRYVAGYDSEDPAIAVIRGAILLMVGDLFKFRETTVTGTIATKVPMSTTVENLLEPLRIYR